MNIGYQYILLILAGIGGIAWGLPAAHRLKSPYDAGAALLVLAGVVVTVMGILLTFVPRFFR